MKPPAQLANAFVCHRLDRPCQELEKQGLTNQSDDTTDTVKAVDSLTIFRAAINLDSEVAVDPACSEKILFHNSYFLWFLKFTPFEVLHFLNIFLIFVSSTPQNYKEIRNVILITLIF